MVRQTAREEILSSFPESDEISNGRKISQVMVGIYLRLKLLASAEDLPSSLFTATNFAANLRRNGIG